MSVEIDHLWHILLVKVGRDEAIFSELMVCSGGVCSVVSCSNVDHAETVVADLSGSVEVRRILRSRFLRQWCLVVRGVLHSFLARPLV